MIIHRFRAIACIGLLIATTNDLFSQDAAKTVVERFCNLDAKGEQLTAGGWQKVAALFVNPGVPRRDWAMVVKDFEVIPAPERSRRARKKGAVSFYVEYTPVGMIDSSEARFSALPPTILVAPSFFIIQQTGQASGPSDQGGEFAGWRIEGPVPEPHLTLDAAIRYATELRAHATTDALRKNADNMLAALKRFR
jgi:hypothetical protein